MRTTPFIKTCKKCGERSEHVATLPHGGGYEIYQCLDCKSVEWVPLNSGSVAQCWPPSRIPGGRIELLTILCEGQAATVLQLPAQQTITAEADAQKHIAYVS